MDVKHFHQMRTALQVGARPGAEPDLREVEATLADVLMDSGVFEEVTVEHTDDPDKLVLALCKFRPFYTERDVAVRLEEIWSDRVRYPFWEAHALRWNADQVEFEAASRIGPDGHYVTVRLIAQRAEIPLQRGRLPRF